MTDLFLGVDVGGTTTKAVLFDPAGDVVNSVSRTGPTLHRSDGSAERDMEEVWTTACAAIAACVSVVDVARIAGVGVVGHSDGIYPIDTNGKPVGNAIQATDRRASSVARSLGMHEERGLILDATGTLPFAGSPAVLASWLLANEPTKLERARWLLFAKDWVRFRLTNEVATDPSDASSSFLDIRSLEYSSPALEVYGLENIRSKLPTIVASDNLAGEVSDAGSSDTGLRVGTPVVVGCHDVDAAAIGLDAVSVGDLSIAAGTFSINQVVTDVVLTDERWQVRAFVEPRRWLAMSTSPTSASNLTWLAEVMGASVSDLVKQAGEVSGEVSDVTFLPYVFGSPDGGRGGSFFGIQSHHGRGHLARAVMEGVVCSHRLHVEWLAEGYGSARLGAITGGAVASDDWVQMFADGLGIRLRAGDGLDTARGAAALAAVGVGAYDEIAGAARNMAPTGSSFSPDEAGSRRFDEVFGRFMELRDATT